MKLYHLIVNSQNILDTFSPIEIVDAIMTRCRGKGELPIDVYTTEIK